MLFAQIPIVTSVEQWLVPATCVFVLFERGLSFYKNHMKETPPPAETYMTNALCGAQHRDLDARVATMERGLALDDTKRAAIYDRVEKVRQELKADIQHLSDKVEVLPLRLLEMIKRNGSNN